MTLPLITTKLGIPSVRPVLVQRAGLVQRLEAGAQGKLTLFSAPAGFGKTTLAAEWLRHARTAVTWLSLDEGDNDPARFLAYLLAALQVIEVQAGRETWSLLQEPQPPSAELLRATLLNELSAMPCPFILVIDDYHIIETLSIQQLLSTIVAHQPEGMHLVLLTREDPPLPLPRLRARGQMTEIRQEDLRFTVAECAEFLEKVMGLQIPPEDIAALEGRTEGWIAGLQLAALSMQGHPDRQHFVQEFTGSNRYVLDYLAQEVFEGQTGEIQEFLLHTAILERLCGPLCQAVTGLPGSQAILENLEQANLFILSLDQSRRWYRYHRLFQDLLRNRLRREGEALVSALHRRASQWFEQNQAIPEAIHHALAGRDWEGAVRLLHQGNDAMLKRGEVFTLLSWYSQVPEGILLAEAGTCLDYSWALVLSGQFEQSSTFLARAERLCANNPALLGQVITAQAYQARAQGDHARMVALSQQALALLPEDDVNARCLVSTNLGIAYWHSGEMQAAESALQEALETARATGNHYAEAAALVFQGMVMAVRGQLREAAGRFQHIAQEGDLPAFLRGLVQLYLGVLHYEWNDLEASGVFLGEALGTGEGIHNDELMVSSWMALAQLQIAGGNLPAARQLLEKAGRRTREGEVPTTAAPRLAAMQVQAALAGGDLETALGWAEHLRENCDSHSFYRFSNLSQATLLLAENKQDEAAAYLARCYQVACQKGWGYGLVAVRTLQALAAGGGERAVELLEEALKLAQPEGYLRTFLDQGPRLKPLLQAAAGRQAAPAYAGRILAALGEKTPKTRLGELNLVEPLTPRELEVLHFLAAGLTNREIASELVISPGTAKTHVHNICGKLQVRNRTEAAARALALGLV